MHRNIMYTICVYSNHYVYHCIYWVEYTKLNTLLKPLQKKWYIIRSVTCTVLKYFSMRFKNIQCNHASITKVQLYFVAILTQLRTFSGR